MTFGSIHLNASHDGRRRGGHLPGRRALLERHDEDLGRPVDGGEEVHQRLLVRRHGHLVPARRRRDARERAAVHRHRVEVVLAWVHLAGGEVDLRAVVRQPGARDLPLAGRQLFRRRCRQPRRRSTTRASSRRVRPGTARACCRAATPARRRRRSRRLRRRPCRWTPNPHESTHRRAGCRSRSPCPSRDRSSPATCRDCPPSAPPPRTARRRPCSRAGSSRRCGRPACRPP